MHYYDQCVYRTGTSATADIQIQQGGDHDRLLMEFESLATDSGPSGILGILEQHSDPYEARVLLCEAFQVTLSWMIYIRTYIWLLNIFL